MLSLDRLSGLIAPNICLGCGREGDVLCTQCLVSAGEPPQSRCAGCHVMTKDYRTCSACRSWLKIYKIYVATNYEGVYEQLVHSLKFGIKRQAADPITTIMAQNIPILSRPEEDVVVCPLPTAPARIRQRGFDHSKLLAKGYINQISKRPETTGWKLQYLLGRKTNVRQLGSSRKKRIEQIDQEFFVKRNVDVNGKTIILLDDVMTTGASLAAAAKTLKKAGSKRVYATVFAQKT